jgi:RHS repeat-associated protein
VQHIEYVPFGEVFIEERNNTWNTPYLFNAKELDEETGLYYYGARYYEPRISLWLSVDPLGEKYPNVSAYVYTFQNPINVIDPDGRDAIYITFPKYKADGYPFTGHAGVLLIDNKTGLTKYYEYGRYDKAENGMVRNYSVANVVMKDGMPTAESLNKVLTQISGKSGKGQVLEGAYVASDNFDVMNDYAKGKLAENNDANRKPYDIFSNNCGTFADDVIKQDKTVETPSYVIPTPINIIGKYQDNFTPISYDPKKGTSIKLTEQTTIYNNQTKTTEIKQNWWQKLWYGNDK